MIVLDGIESRMIVMEYVRYGSLSMFVKDKGKRIPPDERLQLYKQFSLDIAEVRGIIIINWYCCAMSRIARIILGKAKGRKFDKSQN